MGRLIAKYKQFSSEKNIFRSVFLGVFFLLASLTYNHFASIYATERASNAVKDLLLDNLPVYNVDFIVNDGAAIFALYVFILLLIEPKRIPFVLKSAALFILVRSTFIMFTHLGPFPLRSYIDPNDIFRVMSFGGDYFFSGHSGLPFLLALIFWKEINIRIFCLAASFFFGASVLLGHLHYSIDVFAAFFITYTIFVMSRNFFPRDWSRLLAETRV